MSVAIDISREQLAPAKLAGFPRSLGVAIERCTDSLVEGTMVAGPEHTTAEGMRVHGGALMAFADTLGAIGTATQLPAGQWTTTVNSSTHFVAGAVPGLLRGVAHAIHRGRTTNVWHTDIYDSNQRLVAVVIQTQLIVNGADRVTEPNAKPQAMITDEPAGEARGANANAVTQARSIAGDGQTIPEQRLRQIFNAASQVFGKKGYAGASVRDIAEAAGMPIATMYQYVSGKERLLLLVFETYMSEISAALALTNDTSKTPRQRLHDAIEATLRLYDAYRRQIRLMYQEARSFGPENRERVRKLARATHRVWEGIIRDGIAAGEFACRDPSVTANFIPTLCSIWVLRYSSVKGTSLDQLRESILELLEGGLGVASAAHPAAAHAKPSSKLVAKSTARPATTTARSPRTAQ